MDVDLSNLDRALTITGEEDSDVVIPLGLWPSESELEGLYLVRRILSTKNFHIEAMRKTLTTSFNKIRKMEIKMIESNKILFHFEHPIDCKKVLEVLRENTFDSQYGQRCREPVT
ncbi:hypothetical protein Salat_1659100 [Sesamum alatum]|uniref:DUF4283 domain-containing protein n=1 Tax=Sesamum alatum TaxID=300844 RepID=A0AAE2CJP2_9LAMI|nr:hypothetical protein Salat_1659100 [Sesamum alatum]